MKIIGISLALVVLVVGLVYGGLELFGSSDTEEISAPSLEEFQDLQKQLISARLEITVLTERFDELEKEKEKRKKKD